MIISLCRYKDGRPVALIPATGKKEDCDGALLNAPAANLVNKTVTLDLLHNKFDTLDTVVKKGGDYIVGTKDNTFKRLADTQNAL